MKYSIDDIRREYDRLDKLLGIDTRNITLSVSSRCVRRYGVCRYDKDRIPKEICITDFIMECEDSFWDVIRHEYAHALVRIRYPKEKHGHDRVFKAACIEVGCRPERCSDDEEAAQYVKERRKTRAENRKSSYGRTESFYRYLVGCDYCGHEWKYKSKGKVVKIAFGDLDGKLTCPHCKCNDFYCEKL